MVYRDIKVSRHDARAIVVLAQTLARRSVEYYSQGRLDESDKCMYKISGMVDMAEHMSNALRNDLAIIWCLGYDSRSDVEMMAQLDAASM